MATIDELKKKDGSAVPRGAVRSQPAASTLIPLPNQPLAQTFQNTPQKFLGATSPTMAAPAMPQVAQPAAVGAGGASGSWEPNAAPVPAQTGGATGSWSATAMPVAVQAPAQPLAPQVEGQDGYLPNESVMGRAGRRASEVGSGFFGGIKALGQTMNLGAPGAATGMPFNASAGAGRGAVPAGTPVGINEPSPVAPPSLIPAAAAAPIPAQPGSPAAVAAGAGNPAQAPGQPAPADPTISPNKVTRTGNSYSGGPNIKGDIEISGKRGGVISARNNQAAENLARAGGQTSGFGPAGAIRSGGQVSSMDTSAGYAADLKQLAGIEAAKAEQSANMQAQADYAANKVLEGRALSGNRGALQIMSNNARAKTEQRAQDVKAGATRAEYQLAQEKLKLETAKDGRDATAAGYANRSAGRIEALHAAYEAAKPEDKAGLAEQLRVMTGKDKPAQWKALALQGATDSMGNKTEGVLAAVNEQTGEVKRLDQGAVKAQTAPQQAVSMLKANPKMAAEFDAKYGPGQAALILGQK